MVEGAHRPEGVKRGDVDEKALLVVKFYAASPLTAALFGRHLLTSRSVFLGHSSEHRLLSLPDNPRTWRGLSPRKRCALLLLPFFLFVHYPSARTSTLHTHGTIEVALPSQSLGDGCATPNGRHLSRYAPRRPAVREHGHVPGTPSVIYRRGRTHELTQEVSRNLRHITSNSRRRLPKMLFSLKLGSRRTRTIPEEGMAARAARSTVSFYKRRHCAPLVACILPFPRGGTDDQSGPVLQPPQENAEALRQLLGNDDVRMKAKPPYQPVLTGLALQAPHEDVAEVGGPQTPSRRRSSSSFGDWGQSPRDAAGLHPVAPANHRLRPTQSLEVHPLPS